MNEPVERQMPEDHTGRMVSGLTEFSLRRRITLLVLLMSIVVVGIVATVGIPAELFPRGFTSQSLFVFVPWQDAPTIGNLLGTRMVLNEFVAYSQLGPMKDTLDPKSFTIATFALCGFANFSSIGIQIGGIGALAPERRHDLARLGLRGGAGGDCVEASGDGAGVRPARDVRP